MSCFSDVTCVTIIHVGADLKNVPRPTACEERRLTACRHHLDAVPGRLLYRATIPNRPLQVQNSALRLD